MRGYNFYKEKECSKRYKLFLYFDIYSNKGFSFRNPWDNRQKALVINPKNMDYNKKYAK
jgi:hypothetical protein